MVRVNDWILVHESLEEIRAQLFLDSLPFLFLVG